MGKDLEALEVLFSEIFGEPIHIRDISESPAFEHECDDCYAEDDYELDELGCDQCKDFEPTQVIFNEPATIVYWCDGSRTVVKCQPGDAYDKEKGLAMCYMKKLRGNNGSFNKILKEWVKDEH